MPCGTSEQIKNLILQDTEEAKLLNISQAVECAVCEERAGTVLFSSQFLKENIVLKIG